MWELRKSSSKVQLGASEQKLNRARQQSRQLSEKVKKEKAKVEKSLAKGMEKAVAMGPFSEAQLRQAVREGHLGQYEDVG